jgi:two-component system NtrC family sensor kinase
MMSVRFRLLILALLPIIVLLPLFLGFGLNRWSHRVDDLLIENVNSDLRIAEQVLQRTLIVTGKDIRALAQSADFRNLDPDAQINFLNEQRILLGLDFLYILHGQRLDHAAEKWPIIETAAFGETATEIDIFDQETLLAIDPQMAKRAQLPLIATEAAVPTDRTIETRGMMVHSASYVDNRTVLVGGILLNRNLNFIDRINELVYQSGQDTATRQGTATLFLEDVRVSTNVRLFEDVRALGTRVSAAVRSKVLDEGQTWLNRAFVVNDWYISGYLPLIDSFGERVGMLYVGFLETPFRQTVRRDYLSAALMFLIVVGVSVPFFLSLARGIFAPFETMIKTMAQVEDGDLNARIKPKAPHDEIGQVAAHLDHLLDEVQARDEDLSQRVEKRTQELRIANEKLEDTYQQLVMSEKLASIGEITAGLAHEINNPVAVIQGNVDVIRDTLGPAAREVSTELDLVDQQVFRINSMVSKLLKFARPSDYGTFSETVDMAHVVQDCLVLVDHVLTKSNITLEFEKGNSPLVAIDPGELQQVVINLVMNAVHAMGGAGRLFIRVGATENIAELIIRDTGPGVHPDNIGKVFDPFFTTKVGDQGTGLGLSISQNILRRVGGNMSVRNHPEGGAEFTVTLPAVV